MTARIVAIFVALTAAGCAHQALNRGDARDAVERALAARNLAPQTLGVIDNLLAHEAPPPPGSPAIAEALFKDPLIGSDAATLWRRTVPAALERFLDSPDAQAQDFAALLDEYLQDLAKAREMLAAAARPFDEATLVRELANGLPAPLFPGVMAAVERDALERANVFFFESTARFVRALRAPGMRFPEPREFDAAIGRVVIGSRGADHHRSGAALIVDPGGDDVYERAPTLGGSVSVVVDLAGNDQYRGSDVAVRALSALVDVQGNDRYESDGAGLGAAIAGASVLVDYDGDDLYRSRFFGQGAAAFGVGALVDASGADSYALGAFGQGYAGTAGVGLLWDRGGDDVYEAGGLPDAFNRGGGVSFAQGAAAGLRTPLGGGVGILRDDAGDDRYEAQMFAQGAGYYYSLGVLWDGGGRDTYRAIRYAQGNGVHQAAGVLQDDSGDDRYELELGVGQGMGLDMAIGLVFDRQGNDAYQAAWLAQATGTANGVGLLIDRAGQNRFTLTTTEERGWGYAEWERRLPTVAALVVDGGNATFTREGKPSSPPAPRVVHSADDAPTRCPDIRPAASAPAERFVASLHAVAIELASGKPDPARYGEVLRRLIDDPAGAMAAIPPGNFNLVYGLGETLQCALLAADESEAQAMFRAFDSLLDEAGRPFLGVIAFALARRPAPPATIAKLRSALRESPRCSLQALAMPSAPEGEAREALGSSCWRLQAAAYDRLQALGAARAQDRFRLPFLLPID